MTSESKKVQTERKELSNIKLKYCMIQDAINGEREIKQQKEKYLPKPTTVGECDDDQARYAAYLTRAVYYNAIKPTVDALVGQLFLRPPKVTLPELLKDMKDDVNGQGLGIEQLIRRAANHVLPYGRCGFLADFPATEGEVTKQDVDNGIRPFVTFYEPWAIINWQMEKRNNLHKLTLLVLKEVVEVSKSNDFEITNEDRYRVYRLGEEGVTVEVWADSDIVEQKRFVRDHTKTVLDRIPFEFVGSENNDSEVDEPPLYSMASLNIAHYRNSADYEESVFLIGQPTPVYSGLTKDWVDNYFEGGIPFGSRAAVPLPEKATAQLLQASPNTLAFEAMKHKEEQMVSIGAKLINPKQTVERKEAEIQIDAASQRSVLTTIKENLEKAFLSSLKTACLFVNVDVKEIELELNDNFDLTSLTGEELRWLIELYGAQAINFDSLHENLRRSGIVKNTAEEMKKDIVSDLKFRKQVTPVDPVKPLEKKVVENA